MLTYPALPTRAVDSVRQGGGAFAPPPKILDRKYNILMSFWKRPDYMFYFFIVIQNERMFFL